MSEKKTVPVDAWDRVGEVLSNAFSAFSPVMKDWVNVGFYLKSKAKFAAPPLNKQISLPKITEEILDQFEGEEFIERDLETHSPRWTQEAVDFVCLLSQQATEALQKETS